MSTSPIDIDISADASQATRSFTQALSELRKGVLLNQIHRAISVAYANNFTPVRLIVGRIAARDMGAPTNVAMTIWGIPATVDETVPVGFSLVTRPPAT